MGVIRRIVTVGIIRMMSVVMVVVMMTVVVVMSRSQVSLIHNGQDGCARAPTV